MKPIKGDKMEQNPVTQVVGTLVVAAAYLVAAHYVEKGLKAGVHKMRPSIKIPKLSKVKP